ncbi:hypothetical protein ACTFIW_009556 [Dictyostelium discoideum]
MRPLMNEHGVKYMHMSALCSSFVSLLKIDSALRAGKLVDRRVSILTIWSVLLNICPSQLLLFSAFIDLAGSIATFGLSMRFHSTNDVSEMMVKFFRFSYWYIVLSECITNSSC